MSKNAAQKPEKLKLVGAAAVQKLIRAGIQGKVFHGSSLFYDYSRVGESGRQVQRGWQGWCIRALSRDTVEGGA